MTPEFLRKTRADIIALIAAIDRIESEAVKGGRDLTEMELETVTKATEIAQELTKNIQARAKDMAAVREAKSQPREWKGGNLHERRQSAWQHAHDVVMAAKDAGRQLTAEEQADAKSALADVDRFDQHIAEAQQAKATFDQAFTVPAGQPHGGGAKANLNPRVKAAGGSMWGEQVLKHLAGPFGDFKALVQAGSVPVTVPLNPDPVRLDVPVLALRQLIPPVNNSTGYFAYMRQTVRDNNASVVAKGARKPTSSYTLERIDDRVRVIAHLSEPIPRQDLDDAAMLRTFIDQEMRLGLELALEDEIVNGDGTGEHFMGLSNVPGHQDQEFVTDILVTARKAVTRLERYGYAATAGWLMSPDDWEAFELTQDNEARFYFGGPVAAVNAASRRLWGVPVVVSEAAPTGTAFLADFAQTRLQSRQEGVLDWSENMYDPNAFPDETDPQTRGASDFERNMIRFRFEGRFGLEILRPSAIVEVDLSQGS
ncbi:phage major capsid protein, HK97 family [Streptomyces zhaozhouensis]|uniref:Phage major capsid protein, HK97 family n=1 Tax=Streptomyces zhaozhouensis TaxID=1300267 RepID=A0A286DYE7_9ACTN|nr:phage major capsid protein [Streptomyces zhaozhouensis]SOD63663.1 phage major capsid protein, HK97 family [Streptomyces zhaozhouensis]